jgi:lipopolysaccharide transport system ATP-binding protein
LELGAGFNPEFTGRDNVLINGQIMGLSLKEMEDRFEEISSFADIGDFIDQPVKTYSSGMFVRLAFASAINVDPDILLIDEALAVGDAYFQQKCIRKLRQFQENKKTILFVSHDPSAVKTLCQRAILLNEGKLLKGGPPDKVLDFYQGLLLKKMHRGEKEVVISGDAEGKSEGSEKEGSVVREERSNSEVKPRAQSVHGYRTGTDEAFVEEIKLLDKEDHEIESIVSEELLKIKVTVRFRKDLDDPHVGFILRNRLGVPIFGTNTFTAKQRLTPVRNGEALTVIFAFRCILFADDYNITIGIANRGYNVGDFEEYIFFEHHMKIIKVIKNTNSIEYEGMVNLFPTIEFFKPCDHAIGS